MHTINNATAHILHLGKFLLRFRGHRHYGFHLSLCYVHCGRSHCLQLFLILGLALAVVALELVGGVLGNVFDKVIQITASLKNTKRDVSSRTNGSLVSKLK
jgi:hypothetical protein